MDAPLGWTCVNKMSPGTTGDTRAASLVGSLYGSLAGL